MNDAPWRNPQVVLTLFLVFLAGAALGAFGMRSAQSRYLKDPQLQSGLPSISLERWKRELSLTEEQATQLEVILEDFMKYYQSLEEQMRDFRVVGKGKILNLLDDRQKGKFEQMLKEPQTKARR